MTRLDVMVPQSGHRKAQLVLILGETPNITFPGSLTVTDRYDVNPCACGVCPHW